MAYVEIAKKKQAQRQSAIPKEWLLENLPDPEILDVSTFASSCGLLSDNEVQIINTPATQLVQKLTTGILKSYNVVLAYCKAAAVAHQVVNPLTEIFFTEALERAKEIDTEFAKTNKPIGKLHGLPLSIKDSFNIKGYDSTIGFAKLAFDPVQNQSVLVDILQEQGAIFFCKTNIPFAMMGGDSANNCFGRTINPYNRQLGPGGSSGGEGVLVAMHGSALGIGTDNGGSIRIPAAFNHLYGLKPSSGRIPTWNVRGATPGSEIVPSVCGPLAHDIDSLEFFCKVVLDSKPWLRDPKCLPLPWKENVIIPKQLVIGVIESDNICTPTPPVQHALKEFTQILKDAGHILVPITSPPHERLYEFIHKIYTTGGPDALDALFSATGEQWATEMQYIKESTKLDVTELWELQARRTSWVKEVHDMWENTKHQNSTKRPIDCILSPSSVFSAPPPDKHTHLLYTCTWNITDFSSAVFPVGRVRKENTMPPPSFTPKTKVEKRIYADYDPEMVIGAPLSLQITCHKHEDEKALQILRVMAELAKKII